MVGFAITTKNRGRVAQDGNALAIYVAGRAGREAMDITEDERGDEKGE